MRLFFTVAAILVGTYGIDKFLAAQERNELLADAHRLYLQGEQSMRAGHPEEATASFGRAHALERANTNYQIALASAQLANHEIDRARQTLNGVLEDDSNDSRANLFMARALAEQGMVEKAGSFYHRAIYGTWPSHPEQHSAAARLELANLLAKGGNKEELLSELLLIQNQPGTDKSKLAALFLQAGSAARASEVYRELIRQNPEDADAYAGAAQADMQRGEYGAARTALRTALRIRAGDAALQKQEAMAEKLASLDPTPRGLSTAEKYDRSRKILAMVASEVRACSPLAGSGPGPEPDAFLAMPKTITNELAESVLAEAERLWRARPQRCGRGSDSLDPLLLLMTKLSL